MANNPTAIKRARQNATRGAINASKLSEMRTYIKRFNQAVETGEGDLDALFKSAIKHIDLAASHGIIHQNKANREKSKIANRYNQ